MKTTASNSIRGWRGAAARAGLWLLMATSVWAGPEAARNLDRKGVALQGYDPVAFFTAAQPVKGNSAIASTVQGATYYFASAEHKAAFDQAPAKYEPQFGGYCAYGVSRGKLVAVDVNAFQVVDGRLLLQYSRGVREKFNQDVPGNLKRADEQWPIIGKVR